MMDTDVGAGSVVSTAVCSHSEGSASLGAQTWLLKPGTWASSGKESLDVSIVPPAVLGESVALQNRHLHGGRHGAGSQCQSSKGLKRMWGEASTSAVDITSCCSVPRG